MVQDPLLPHNLGYVNRFYIHLVIFGNFYKKTKLFIVTYVAFRDAQ